MSNFEKKAEENLNAAIILFDNQYYNASANRSYYATFQSAIHALSNEGFNIQRISHEAAQSLFAGELINRKKKFPSKLKASLSQLRIIRNDADYELKQVSQKIAKRQLRKAQEFINIVLRGK